MFWFLTNAVVAISVLFFSLVGVGANGVPEKEGLTNGAYKWKLFGVVV